MELENHTRYPALLFRAIADEERMLASVTARVTYDLLPGGELLPAGEQVWKISAPPWDGPRGRMESDEVFYRGGVDLFVFGSARPPREKPAPRGEVRVRVGAAFDRRFAIFGDRVWRKERGGLVAGPPAPFTAVPLGPQSAFGGKDVWDELDIPYPANPDGKGYYLTEESAEGRPLPNLEDPAYLVRKWDDKPPPVWLTLCPMNAGPRLENGVEVDLENREISKIKAEFFNAAHPALIVPRVDPGDRMEVAGVSERGPVWFTVPPLPLVTRVRFGAEVFEKHLRVDQIGVEPDEDRVFITYRYPFRYPMIALQRRACELAAVG